MDERMRFVLEQESGLHSMTELCAIYNIARATGYYWLRRYRQGKDPLPLHPIPSKHRRKKCQGCARSKVSDMFPTVPSFTPTGLHRSGLATLFRPSRAELSLAG
jgi:transposase